ncbi:phosphatases II [Artomyces pyxidatus]|uniref:Phosphatases II n=1 Tax=Artomyces pyxidatus TaxID=48021 RepID=A0ACB8T5V2_9AGAM|nr:phosphatases II [Artomyces pyxidatus]
MSCTSTTIATGLAPAPMTRDDTVRQFTYHCSSEHKNHTQPSAMLQLCWEEFCRQYSSPSSDHCHDTGFNVDTESDSDSNCDADDDLSRSLCFAARDQPSGVRNRIKLFKSCTTYTQDDSFFPQATSILPGLYLSDLYTATSTIVLEDMPPTHIVSAVRSTRWSYKSAVNLRRIPIENIPHANLLGHLQKSVDWIDAALQTGGTVLTHCRSGNSRGASVIIAYLIAKKRMSVDEALAYVKSRRPFVQPNIGFLAQLAIFERNLKLQQRRALLASCGLRME